MKLTPSFSPRRVLSRAPLLSALCAIAIGMGLATGCGSSGTGGGQQLSGNTSVTVMLSSTANDQLPQFDIGFQSITLTSQSGKTATLLSTPTAGSPLGAEFVHINGTAEPLVTASIPQDVYTSATVTLGGAQFICVALFPGSLATNTFNGFGVNPSSVTVTLPSPITVTGASASLDLDLQVAQSESYSDCYNNTGVYTFSVTPTFNLTALSLSSSPSSSANGKVSGLEGEITAVGTAGNTITLTLPDPLGSRTLSINSGGNTLYQGIGGFSALAVGMFVDADAVVQSDGSLLATRVAVEDPSALNILSGPLLSVAPSTSNLLMLPREQQGSFFSGVYAFGSMGLNFGSAIFQTSGQFTNLGDLPFAATFNTNTIVPGQNVYATTGTIPQSGPYIPATTMTLMPQTINGTVAAATQSGNFTDYTVTLASSDLFPMLAIQPDQTIVENNPSQVEVYVGSNTQLLNTMGLASGSTLRFYGLVFDDNGTLRMDCAQVNDGVALSPASNGSSHSTLGEVQTLKRTSSGIVPQVITTVTQAH